MQCKWRSGRSHLALYSQVYMIAPPQLCTFFLVANNCSNQFITVDVHEFMNTRRTVIELTFQYMKLTGSTTVGWTISLPGKIPHVTALGCISGALVRLWPWRDLIKDKYVITINHCVA